MRKRAGVVWVVVTFSACQFKFKYENTAIVSATYLNTSFFFLSSNHGDRDRKKYAANLRISSSAKNYRSREDVDEFQIALSLEIPNYLL